MRLSELDTNLTYCIGISPAPNTMTEVRKYQECAIPHNERWTQVGIGFFLYDAWAMIYCDINEHGVSLESLCLTLTEAEERQAQVFTYPYPFDIVKAKSMIGTPFSWIKLKAFKSGVWEKASKDAGVTCAEFLALCQNPPLFLPEQVIEFKPVTWQLARRDNIERLEL